MTYKYITTFFFVIPVLADLTLGHPLSPVDDFFTLRPYEVLSLGGQDAQRVLLPRPGLPIDDIRALVHVDGALGQSAGLETQDTESVQ